MELFVTMYESPIGPLKIVACNDYITNIDFVKQDRHENDGYLAKYFSQDIAFKGENSLTKQAEKELREYFAGKRRKFDVKIEFFGTDFQNNAWKSLCNIPYGEVRTYKQQAESVGSPKGFRAVGQANHHNPIPIIVPCHRVVGFNHKMVGFGGGIDVKETLLNLESMYK